MKSRPFVQPKRNSRPSPAEPPLAFHFPGALAYNPPPPPAAPSVPVISPNLQPTPEPDDADLIAELEKELAEKEQEVEKEKAEKEKAEKKAQTYKTEAGLAWQTQIEAHDKNRARGETIKAAFLQARITNWSPESGFGVIEIIRPESVQVGTVLAIRRQTGIYGQVKVSQMYEAGQAVIDPIPSTFLGEEGIDLQPGDELIIPPL